ncbi:hypothetical protein LS68_009045 [Helicobacter sp. MIT 05-5293]|uniref:hypothetical protein n=1 Tax=Helicobacter sp. MIT 05-5293 TaxID=1548149 RepID=UPI00051D51AB|nr:hypothetical protein [Helicobacter sp. MIT 05-5293]TLD79975.1 hypothetical protein LS68_009045 [Helicobacter sp. MIT 05-5293]
MSFKSIFLPPLHTIQIFLNNKTPREKILLATASALCILFVMIDFVYLPLVEKYTALSSLYQHTFVEFTQSQDSINHSKQRSKDKIIKLETNLEKERHLYTQLLNEIHTLQGESQDNYALMKNIIKFVETQPLTLSSIKPHHATQSLQIKGAGGFSDIISLLTFIESDPYLSIDYLAFAHTPNQIDFELLLLNEHLELPQKYKQ